MEQMQTERAKDEIKNKIIPLQTVLILFCHRVGAGFLVLFLHSTFLPSWEADLDLMRLAVKTV